LQFNQLIVSRLILLHLISMQMAITQTPLLPNICLRELEVSVD